MDDFLKYVKKLNTNINNLIIAGDYNICHKAIDIHDPVRNKNISGFLPIERSGYKNLLIQDLLILSENLIHLRIITVGGHIEQMPEQITKDGE